MPARPKDPNQRARAIVQIATGEAADGISPAKRGTKRRGRPGGLKGGKVRAKKLTRAQRVEIAKIAAEARWKKGR